MATFTTNTNGNDTLFTFYIVNNCSSNTGFYYNLEQLSSSGCPSEHGTLAAGASTEVSLP